MYKPTSIPSVNLAAVVIAILMFLAYVLARTGLGNDLNFLPLCLSISILLLPGILEDVVKLPAALLQFFILILFFALGWISILLAVDLSAVVYATGIISLFPFFRRLDFSVNKRVVIAGLLILFLALKLIAILWTTNYYLSPLAPEAYALNYLHIDTLYLAGLTAIIKTYQATSTGLFGLIPVQYHAGSNFLFASFSELCNLGALRFYNLAFPVIFVPMFFQTFFYAAFSGLRRKPDTFRFIIGLVIVFFVFSGVLPNSVGRRFLLFTSLNNHFLSESYCISLILTFLFIALYSPFFRANHVDQRPPINILLILLIPIWFFAIGYAKISTAVVLFSAFCYFILRRKLIFQKWILLSMTLTIILFPYLLFLTVESNREATFAIDLGSFYKYYVNESLLIYFLLHYCFLAIMIFLFLLLVRKSDQGIVRDLRAGKYIVPETILVAAVVGILPGLLIEIEGGSAIYFSDIQNWLSILAITALAPFLVYKFYKVLNKRRLVVPVLSFILLILIVRESVFRSFYYFLQQNLRVRTTLMYGDDYFSRPHSSGPTFMGRPISFSSITEIFEDCMSPRESPQFNSNIERLKLPLLENLRALHRDIKERSVIYCEDLAHLPKFKDCGEAFYLTSFTGIALINGLYWKPCFPSGEYAWRYYPESPVEMSKQTAFQLAREKGFSHVIVLNLANNSYSIVDV